MACVALVMSGETGGDGECNAPSRGLVTERAAHFGTRRACVVLRVVELHVEALFEP